MAQRDSAHGDLQRCRTRLIRFLLQKLSSAELDRTTLVFDARVPPPDRPSEFRISGLRVQFANPGGDADEMIERLLAEHSAPGRVTLISSDRRLQTAARRRRAKPVASEEFFEQMERRERLSRHGDLSAGDPYSELKQGRSMTTGELAAWEKVFGDIPGTTWSTATPRSAAPPASAKIDTAPAANSDQPQKSAADSARKKKSSGKPPTSAVPHRDARSAGIPEVTWNDLCRWLDDETWLAEFSPPQDGGSPR